MAPADKENGIVARVAVLESEHGQLQKDVTEIKSDVKDVRDALASKRWTRGERISFFASMVAASGLLIVAANFILQAAHP